MEIQLTILLSIISVSAAVFFGVKSYLRTKEISVADRTREFTTISVKLDETISLSKETKEELRQLRCDISEHNSRIGKLEFRLDELEKKVR